MSPASGSAFSVLPPGASVSVCAGRLTSHGPVVGRGRPVSVASSACSWARRPHATRAVCGAGSEISPLNSLSAFPTPSTPLLPLVLLREALALDFVTPCVEVIWKILVR